MSTKAKAGFAILAAAFLLLNPVGACGSMRASAPAHPCCPVKQAPASDCQGSGCTCAIAPQAPVSLAANDGQRVAVDLPEIAVPGAAFVAPSEVPPFARVLFACHDRYVSFHQLLL